MNGVQIDNCGDEFTIFLFFFIYFCELVRKKKICILVFTSVYVPRELTV